MSLLIILFLFGITLSENEYRTNRMPHWDDNYGVSIKPDETFCLMSRDNVCLSTNLYYPINGTAKPWTTVYSNTPYGKGSLNGLAQFWTEQGFAFAGQDVRGKGGSNGSYAFFRTQGNDSIDSVQYLIKQPWSDTYGGVTGVSADALGQYADIPGIAQGGGGEAGFWEHTDVLNHGIGGYLIFGDGFGRETVYQGGAYRECLITGWLAAIFEEPSIVKVLENEEFDPFWYPLVGNWTWNNAYNPNPGVERQWDVTNLSIVHSAGWYDIFGNLQILTGINVNVSGQANAIGNQIVVVDPGGHCAEGGEIRWKNATFGHKQMDIYVPKLFRGAVEAKKQNKIFKAQDFIPYNVLFYVLGPGGEEKTGHWWVAAKGFPEFVNTPYYFSGKKLVTTSDSNEGNSTYTYDPHNPVRTHGGNNLICQPCGPWAQNQEFNRTDILHFTSDPLTKEFAIVGMITVKLFISSDVVDTDFTAKIIDIYPNGVPMLVQDGIQRMRWRNGPYEANKAPHMKTDEIYEVDIMIGMMSYIWNVKHSISVSISSSNFPRFSVNWNNGLDVIDGNTDYKIANNTIHFGGKYASQLILPVVDLQWLKDHEA
eukprot:243370_1